MLYKSNHHHLQGQGHSALKNMLVSDLSMVSMKFDMKIQHYDDEFKNTDFC